MTKVSTDGDITVTVDRSGWADWRMRMTWWNPPEGPLFRSWTASALTERGAYRKAERIYEFVTHTDQCQAPLADVFLTIETEEHFEDRHRKAR